MTRGMIDFTDELPKIGRYICIWSPADELLDFDLFVGETIQHLYKKGECFWFYPVFPADIRKIIKDKERKYFETFSQNDD